MSFSIRLAAVSLAVLSAHAHAQAWPTRPVRFVVPSAPGASTDFSARLIAGRMAPIWKQQVVVENRPGANFIIGTEYVTKQPPDGYTLLFSTLGGPSLNPAIYPTLSYKADDLVPVVQTASNTVLLYINSSVPAKTAQEFIALLRANPGKYNHASGGTSTYMMGHLLRSLAKVDFVDVNYKGGAPAFASLMTGDTHFSFGDTNTALAAEKAGRIRPLAAASRTRSQLMPDMPTLGESGVPGFQFTSGVGIFAPAGTPMDIVRRINADVQPVVRHKDVVAALEKTGTEAVTGPQEEFARLVRSELELWSKLVRERNIKVTD